MAKSSQDSPPRPEFYLVAWRLLFDLSFFIIVTTIGLNIVFGIIVDTFSELRDERVSDEGIIIAVYDQHVYTVQD